MGYNELIEKKNSLLNALSSRKADIDFSSREYSSIENELNGLDDDLQKMLSKAESESLNNEIEKATADFYKELDELNGNKEILLANKQKWLDAIQYEVYASKLKDNLSVDSCLNQYKEMYDALESKQGARLTKLLFSKIESDSFSVGSLDDIENLFDEISWKIEMLTKNIDILNKVEDYVFALSVDFNDPKQLLMTVAVAVVLIGLVLYSTPVMVILMAAFVCYKVWSCYFISNCIAMVNSIASNLESIKNSIEEGIKAKMEEDRTTIEVKFSAKLSTVESRIEEINLLKDRKVDEVKESFVYDPTKLKESYRVKQSSLKDKLANIKNQVENFKKDCVKIEQEIKNVDEQIIELSKNVFNNYYGLSKEKSVFFPNEILLDIVDNEPKIYKVPRNSSVIIFKDETEMFKFVELLSSLVYSNVKCSSFKIHYYDTKYMGNKSLKFIGLDNFNVMAEQKPFESLITELLSEMKKRVRMLMDKDIDDYNKEVLKEGSVPLSYDLVFDFSIENKNLTDYYKQLIVNSASTGIFIYKLITQNNIDFTGKGTFWEFLDLYDECYTISEHNLIKRDKSFFRQRIKK